MKRMIKLFVLLLTASLFIPTLTFASNIPISVIFNGETLKFNENPYVEQGTTMVEFRTIFEKFGLKVGYDSKTKTVSGNKDGLEIKLILGQKTAYINGEEKELLVAPKIVNGYTFVPLRFVSEASGSKIVWLQDQNAVKIHHGRYVTTITFYLGVYSGEVIEEWPDGIGTYKYNDGTVYTGEWKNGFKHGIGKLVTDSYTYEGDFVNDRPTGEGKITLNDGTSYVGGVLDGVMHGDGKLSHSDGTYAEGVFNQGKMNGIFDFYTKEGKLVARVEYVNDLEIRRIPLDSNVTNDTKENSYDIPTNLDIRTVSDLKSFLDTNFGSLETTIGTTQFSFDIIENTSILFPYDYWIRVRYDSLFFYDVRYSNKITSTERQTVKQELKDFQERLAKAVIEAAPSKKLYGGYYDSWYKYPALKVGLETRHYYSWTNFDGGLLASYEDTVPGAFRWYDFIDDEF